MYLFIYYNKLSKSCSCEICISAPDFNQKAQQAQKKIFKLKSLNTLEVYELHLPYLTFLLFYLSQEGLHLVILKLNLKRLKLLKVPA